MRLDILLTALHLTERRNRWQIFSRHGRKFDQWGVNTLHVQTLEWQRCGCASSENLLSRLNWFHLFHDDVSCTINCQTAVHSRIFCKFELDDAEYFWGLKPIARIAGRELSLGGISRLTKCPPTVLDRPRFKRVTADCTLEVNSKS